MYLESIKFKRNEDSEWEKGYYVGKTDNCKESVILDSNYQPLPNKEEGYRVWDYHTDTENWVIFRSPEPEDIIWKNLSNEAKSILEGIENDKKSIAEIIRDKDCKVDSLFNEIKRYVNTNNNIKVIINNDDVIKFTLK